MLKLLAMVRHSLLAWIVALVIGVQLLFLAIGFVYFNVRIGNPDWDLSSLQQKTGHVLSLFDRIVHEDIDVNEGAILPAIPGGEVQAWRDVTQNNPQFWYYFEDGSRTMSGGQAPLTIDRLRQLLVTASPQAGECAFFDMDRAMEGTQVASYATICADGTYEIFEVGGVEQDYVPQNYWYGSAIGPDFNSRELLQSYLIVVLLTPFLLFFLLAPLRRVSRAARTLSLTNRNQRLPSQGVFTEMRGVVDSINGALERIDQGFAREQQLRNAVAHELRTPLTVLRARLEQLPDTPTKAELIGDARRLKQLIDRILEFAAAAQKTEDLEELNLVAVTRAVCAQSNAAALQRKVEMQFDYACDHIRVIGVESGIALILQNIVNNALEHNDDLTLIEILVREDASVVIRDDGNGLPPELIAAVADIASGEHYSLRYECMGFGLLIVFELLRLLSGSITCRNLADGGSEFVVTFLASGGSAEGADRRSDREVLHV